MSHLANLRRAAAARGLAGMREGAGAAARRLLAAAVRGDTAGAVVGICDRRCVAAGCRAECCICPLLLGRARPGVLASSGMGERCYKASHV